MILNRKDIEEYRGIAILQYESEWDKPEIRERCLIFGYSGNDKAEKSLELANLLKSRNIDFVAYNHADEDHKCTFVVRRCEKKWKDIIELANSVKPMANLYDCKYYYKEIIFYITDERKDGRLGNIVEIL